MNMPSILKNKKKLVVLGGGLYHVHTYEVLKEGGYYTICVDGNENAPAKNLADEFYAINFSDKEAVHDLVKKIKPDGIMPLNEWGVKTAAFIHDQTGLPGLSSNDALACSDKGFMRDRWKKDNLSIPDYRVIENYFELEKASDKIGYPNIVKPSESGGSGRGISIVNTKNDLEWAYNFALPFAKNKRIIIEEFIEGTELTIETFSIDGKVYTLAISDKEKPDLRTRVATSLNYPAKLPEGVEDKVKSLVSRAVLSLGIINGMAHSEMILTKDNDLFLIETGARGGGGHIFHTIIEKVSGVKAPLIYAEYLTGGKPEINEITRNGSVYRFFNPPHGILKEVKNIDIAGKTQGVIDIGIVKMSGDEVGNLENSLHRAGHVITIGKDREEAIKVADIVENIVEFIIE